MIALGGSCLGGALLIGRVFTRQEEETNEPVAVVSFSPWQTRVHGGPQVLGSNVQLDPKPYVIVGVMARDFEFPLVPGHLKANFGFPSEFRPPGKRISGVGEP